MALVTGNAEPTAPVGRHQSDAAAGTRPRAELDQVMMPADLERLHKELREFERIDAVSDEMRAVIELRPELVPGLRPKEVH
jgi:hypothetical protein